MDTLAAVEPAQSYAPASAGQTRPTMWGFDAVQLHDRFWASHGVQVIRAGERYEIVEGAELFMLCDPRTLALVQLREVVKLFMWTSPELVTLRIGNSLIRGFHPSGDSSVAPALQSFAPGLNRVAFTADRGIARQWHNAQDVRCQWRQLRRQIPRLKRATLVSRGTWYDRDSAGDVQRLVGDLVVCWRRPDAVIPGIVRLARGVWGPAPAGEALQRIEGPAWIGAGRMQDAVARQAETESGQPVVLWDDDQSRPKHQDIEWKNVDSCQPNGTRTIENIRK